MVKNKQKYHLFIQKTYKKTFYHVIFTILLLRLRKELFGKKFLVRIAENQTVRIERRHFQVIHNILLFNFIRLEFNFKS